MVAGASSPGDRAMLHRQRPPAEDKRLDTAQWSKPRVIVTERYVTRLGRIDRFRDWLRETPHNQGRRSPGSMAATVGTRPATTWRNIVYGNKTAAGPRGAGRSWSRAAIGLAAAGLATLGALVLTGASAVAASAPAGAATAQAAAGTPQIYWTNAFPGTIGRANIDGTGAVQNLIGGGSQPNAVAVDAAHIYWVNVLPTNTGAGTIGRANLDGTGVNQDFITGIKPMGGLAVGGGTSTGATRTTHGCCKTASRRRSRAPTSTAPASSRISSPAATPSSGWRSTARTSTGSTRPPSRSGAPTSTAPASTRTSSPPGHTPKALPSIRGTCTGAK